MVNFLIRLVVCYCYWIWEQLRNCVVLLLMGLQRWLPFHNSINSSSLHLISFHSSLIVINFGWCSTRWQVARLRVIISGVDSGSPAVSATLSPDSGVGLASSPAKPRLRSLTPSAEKLRIRGTSSDQTTNGGLKELDQVSDTIDINWMVLGMQIKASVCFLNLFTTHLIF